MDTARLDRLNDYLNSLIGSPSDGRANYLAHQHDLERVTPLEIMELFNRQLLAGVSADDILGYLDKAINVFAHALKDGITEPITAESDPFLYLLARENEGLEVRLEWIRTRLLSVANPSFQEQHSNFTAFVGDFQHIVTELSEINQHYLKKENILFPLLERKHPRFAGLTIMWALHDRARQLLKQASQELSAPGISAKRLNLLIGQLFFMLKGLVNKENWLLFPIVREQLGHSDQLDMLGQCHEYGGAFLTAETYHDLLQSAPGVAVMPRMLGDLQEAFLKTPTGQLTAAQAIGIFNALPVDLSFVDATDKVQYFTRPKDRIFPRSPAVIGRDVDRCHPPSSVHVVRQIIETFRSGERDHARFWINLQGRKVLIEYFAVRDEKDTYLGVLEVSQDITDIMELTGEQRLLDWT
ncbi:MAG: PAS domain-containing protein [Eubacteriales bacterium]|nr:PAS domain-containing protein [Eubacteriales bacterium]